VNKYKEHAAEEGGDRLSRVIADEWTSIFPSENVFILQPMSHSRMSWNVFENLQMAEVAKPLPENIPASESVPRPRLRAF
jgi:hypothetical protein